MSSWLSALTILPLAGGLAVLLLGRYRQTAARILAVAVAITALMVSLVLWHDFNSDLPGMQFEEFHAWVPSLGMTYHLGADGLGILMLVLAAVVVLMSLAASWKNKTLGSTYFALVLFLEAGLFGTFTALNFLHWFLFWELSLIPAFFLVRLWGGPGRARASMQFFVYTMVGSVALLLAFLAMYVTTGTFEFTSLAQFGDCHLAIALQQHLRWSHSSNGTTALIIFWAAFLGFAVKTPVVPFHTWLPDTYAEAPTETTMLLTGAMSKMGIYGFLRILLPIFPQQMQEMRTPLLWFAVATIILPAFAAWAQKDLKRIFAYSSINHLGYCVLAICATAKMTGADRAIVAEKSAALTGALLQVSSHALTAATLFWFVALLERRSGLRGIDDFGGLRKTMPVFCGLIGIAVFASLGLPGLNGFPGEFLIFKGVFPFAGWAASLSLLGLMMTAVFLLTIMQKVFSGPLSDVQHEAAQDLTTNERWMLAPAIALMLVLGVYPQLITGKVHATVNQWAASLAQPASTNVQVNPEVRF